MSDIRINRALGIPFEDLEVVVVDDSKPMQTIVRSMLSAARVHRVRTFDDARDAYRAMLVEPPHVLITDWNLPDMDGLALVRSLRDPRSGPLASIPVILVTAHATRRLIEMSIASGVHFVLAKPLSPANVIKRVQAAMMDQRRFALDHSRGHYVLEGADDLLAAQRQRWADLGGGDIAPDHRAVALRRRRQSVTVDKSVPPPVPTASKTPAASPAAQPRTPSFGSVTRRGPADETPTGQPSYQAS